MLFQSANMIEHLTMAGNLSLARALVRGSRGDKSDVLRSLGIQGRSSAYPSQLSGGELARAGLAIALANDPTVLIADEPTGELDSVTEARILDLLTATAERGIAVIVASHSPAVAAVATRVVRLDDGMMCS
jgi:putative ABC transport system ATP-binding protein